VAPHTPAQDRLASQPPVPPALPFDAPALYGRAMASNPLTIPLDYALGILPPHRRVLARQFLQFGIIGTLGFVWDTCIVYALTPHLGPYIAGLISFFIVASINWGANRWWTYRGHDHDSMHVQLVRFLMANAVGLVLNRGTMFTLVATVPLCRVYLILPVAAGGIAGMFVNFFLSRRLVFR
jgi:putative flippase GtrA